MGVLSDRCIFNLRIDKEIVNSKLPPGGEF